MEKEIRVLIEAAAKRDTLPTTTGAELVMLRLDLKVQRQSGAGLHPAEDLPPIWMEPATAALLVQGLDAKLRSQFPELFAGPSAASSGASMN